MERFRSVVEPWGRFQPLSTTRQLAPPYLVLRGEGRLAGRQLEEQATERPDVRCVVAQSSKSVPGWGGASSTPA